MTEREKLVEWAKAHCNNPDLKDEGGFAYALDNIEGLMQSVGVTSESLSDMSQTFGKDAAISVKNILSPYKRVKML